MRSKLFLALFAVSSVAVLSSCSGLKSGGCTTNCGGGTGNVTISLYDTPPTGTTVLSFTLPIVGISLTPSSGSPVALTAALPSVELTRLQSDSVVIVDAAAVTAQTYSSISLTVGPTSSTNNVFINSSGGTITSGSISCLNGTVCALPVGAVFTLTSTISFTVAENQNQWIGLDFNLAKAITTPSANTIAVDFSQIGVLTATTTVRTGLPSGSVETMEDFTGVVTAVSTASITVQNKTSGASLTAALTSGTEYDIVPSSYANCPNPSAVQCVQIGTTVSMDATVSSAGTFTATEVDVLDFIAVDEVEGVIYPGLNANVVNLVLADKVSASGDATLAASTTTSGTVVSLDVSTLNPSFGIDTKTLSIPLSTSVNGAFTGQGDLFAGQVIRAQVANLASATNGISAKASNILLRYSRLSGTINSVAGSTGFTISNLPTFVTLLNPTLGTAPTVGTYLNYTAFDGVTGTTDSNFQVGAAVSMRALYLNNSKTQTTFPAAKVRVP